MLPLPQIRKNQKMALKAGLLAMTDGGIFKKERVEEEGTGELSGRVRLRWRAEGCMRGVSKLLSLGHIYNILDVLST